MVLKRQMTGPRAGILAGMLVGIPGHALQEAGGDVPSQAELHARLEAQDPSATWPFDGPDSWRVVEAYASGPGRVRAVLEALERSPEDLSREHLMLAWNTAVAEAGALRLELGALPIQMVLFERYPTTWSAIDLALTTASMGQSARADGLLAEAIEFEGAAGQPTGDLWSRRGLIALGNGDKELARDYLGRGRARGSIDATQVLSKMALDAGDLEAARRGFRGLLANEPAVAWAHRGWGLTLLPTSPASPRTVDLDDTH